MKIHVVDTKAKPSKTDLLVLFVPERAKPKLPPGVEVHANALADVRGEFREQRIADGLTASAKRVLFLGLGKPADLTVERARRAAALGVQRAESIGAASATLW